MALSKLITVLLAEDHAIVRQGLCALLNADGHFLIVGEVRTGCEAVKMAAVLKPDVILMDIAMPVLNGLEATRQILAANPAAKVIVLSAHSDDEYIKRMCTAGVCGFLEKQTSAEILTKAIREVAAGGVFSAPPSRNACAKNSTSRVPATVWPRSTAPGSPPANPRCCNSWPKARPTNRSRPLSALASRRSRSTGSISWTSSRFTTPPVLRVMRSPKVSSKAAPGLRLSRSGAVSAADTGTIGHSIRPLGW